MVHAHGDKGRPMLIFQGSFIPLRTVRVWSRSNESIASMLELLSRHALIHMKKYVASVDWWNVFEYQTHFIVGAKELRFNGRILLFIYDWYRFHLSVPVIEKFRQNGIIGYAISAHTSTTTNSLDVAVFPAFKNIFKNLCPSVAKYGWV